MDDLIARVLAGDATDIEKQHLRHWTQEDPRNEQLFRDTEAVWKAFGVMAGAPAAPAPDVSDIVRSARRRRFLPGKRTLLAAAAFVAVAAGGTFLYLRTAGRDVASVPGDFTPALTLVGSVVGSGGVSTVTLSDGSVVRLAPGARLDLLPPNGARAVALEGRAFFAVAPGSDPFTVTTPSGSAQVLGTRFEVATSSDGTRVVVVEGTVLLTGTWGPSERAGANAVATLTRGARPRLDVLPDPWSLLDWPGGLLLFQATPLSDVARELERRFGVDVSVTDPSLATRRVTAWFGDEPFEQVLEAVCLVTAVSCRVASGAAYIGG